MSSYLSLRVRGQQGAKNAPFGNIEMRKLVTIIIAATTAVAAYANDAANVEGYYAPGGYYVSASPGPGQCGCIYPSKQAAEAAEGHHTAQFNDWKVGPPGPKQTEDWGKPATKPVNLIGHLLGVFGHLFGK